MMFCRLYYQSPGVAEADLERDLRLVIRGSLYFFSGDRPRDPQAEAAAGAQFMVPRTGDLLGRMRKNPLADPEALPAWISQGDVDQCVGDVHALVCAAD
jgi:hypothetical protein